ncbi:MAG: hypothetical protein ACREFX_03950 [Opitutaceae bacterium]
MKTHPCLAVGLALGVILLAGCSTPASRISGNPAAFAALPPGQQALVRSGHIGVGMSMEAVTLALGNPDRITIRSDAGGQTQTWHYVEDAYVDGPYLYAGWWGGPYRRRWRWGGWWGPGPYGYEPVAVYDRFRVVFRNGAVTSFSQELPRD